MKLRWKQLLICLAIPLGVGGLGALLAGGMGGYGDMVKPPLSPPGWVFPIVWTILYLLMGYASYRIYRSKDLGRKRALQLYAIQLALNFIWPLVFFGGQWYLVAFFVLIALWGFILLTIAAFSKIDQVAADLLLPYLLWVTFAGYLNLGVYLLN